MTRIKLLFSLILVFCLCGCATPGLKFIDLAYMKDSDPTQEGRMGIAQFKDTRRKTAAGYVGLRILTDKSQETYLVRGQNLGASLTDLTRIYLEETGFTVTPIPDWPPTLAGVENAPQGLDQLLSADINTFECKAQKNGAVTKMVLEIDLTFYLGNIRDKRLSTIPVSLTLERTELTFTQKKLEQFIDQAFEEIVEKALPFK
ncbi:MAG: hypothetical protein KKC20_11020 [Proteobacteria bacterium]|nr:hypothetical protein [Pseudomonadota bacterium]